MAYRTLPLFALGALLALAHPASAADRVYLNPDGTPMRGWGETATLSAGFDQDQIKAIRTITTARLARDCPGVKEFEAARMLAFMFRHKLPPAPHGVNDGALVSTISNSAVKVEALASWRVLDNNIGTLCRGLVAYNAPPVARLIRSLLVLD